MCLWHRNYFQYRSVRFVYVCLCVCVCVRARACGTLKSLSSVVVDVYVCVNVSTHILGVGCTQTAGTFSCKSLHSHREDKQARGYCLLLHLLSTLFTRTFYKHDFHHHLKVPTVRLNNGKHARQNNKAK